MVSVQWDDGWDHNETLWCECLNLSTTTEIIAREWANRSAPSFDYEPPSESDNDDEQFWCRRIWPNQTQFSPVQVGVVDYLMNAGHDHGLSYRDLTPVVPHIARLVPGNVRSPASMQEQAEVIAAVVEALQEQMGTLRLPVKPLVRQDRPTDPVRVRGPRPSGMWSGSRVAPVDALDSLPQGERSSRLHISLQS